jgi:hypothetical protein
MCRDGQLDDGLTGPQTTQASSNIGLLAWMEYLITIRVRLSRSDIKSTTEHLIILVDYMPRTDYTKTLLIQRWYYHDHQSRESYLYQERQRLREEQKLQPKMTCADYVKILNDYNAKKAEENMSKV